MKMSSVLETHPAAEAFPLLEGQEFQDLVADVGRNGLRIPIVLHDGKILDGRNRYRACLEARVEPAFEKFDGKDPISYVVSVNLKRRHLTESQRSMVAARLATMGRGRPRNAAIAAFSQGRIAKQLNVSPDSVGRARVVLSNGHPALASAVDRGEVAVAAAADLARAETPERQREILQVSELEGVSLKDARNRLTPGMFTSERDDWCTPSEIIAAVREVFGTIELDPCSNANSDVGARTEWTVKDDGLRRQWDKHGTIYVNPPYGGGIGEWISKCAEAGRCCDVIALVPARTDTKWFRQIFETSTAICFVLGRLTFKGAPDPAPFPSVVAYWGERGEFQTVFSRHGFVVLPGGEVR